MNELAGTLDPTVQAVIDRLTGLVPPITVYDGHVPASPAFPYVVVYLGWKAHPTAIDSVTDQFDGSVQVTSVGANAKATRIIAQRVAVALVGFVPTVPGRTCWPITHEWGQPAREDRDVHINGIGHPLYAVDGYRVASVPA